MVQFYIEGRRFVCEVVLCLLICACLVVMFACCFRFHVRKSIFAAFVILFLQALPVVGTVFDSVQKTMFEIVLATPEILT